MHLLYKSSEWGHSMRLFMSASLMQSRHTVCLSLLLGLAACFATGCNGGGDDADPPVGPNLNGRWTGRYYSAQSSDTREFPMTATIRHDGSAIRIQTSLTGVGATLSGTIEPNGEMSLIDPYDGEIWTTYFEPASTERVRVADFLYDDDLGARSPLQVIDLRRAP